MSLFNIFSNQETAKPISNIAKEFNRSSCQCIQQSLDLSELRWMDSSAYIKSKEMLQKTSDTAIKARFEQNNQKDLFN